MWTIDTFLDQQIGLLLRDEPVGPDGRRAARRRTATTGSGTASGTRGRSAARSAGRSRSRSRSARSTSIRTPTPGASTSSARCGARTRRASGRAGARNQGLNRLTNAGLLTGIDERRPRGAASTSSRTCSAPPTSAPGRGDSRVDQRRGRRRSISSTTRRPGVRTNLTINTDFAQTEVDQRQVNLDALFAVLSREARLLPRRATFFDFQSTAANDNSPAAVLQPPHRARAKGVPQKIKAGGKLAGQFGSNDVGALYVRTGREEDGDRRGLRRAARQAPHVPAVVRRRALHRPPRAASRASTRVTRSAPTSCSPRRRSSAVENI